jgi:hypothetical protein
MLSNIIFMLFLSIRYHGLVAKATKLLTSREFTDSIIAGMPTLSILSNTDIICIIENIRLIKYLSFSFENWKL